MKKTFKIPDNVMYVTVEATTDGISTIFEPRDTGAFISNITEELEYVPSKEEGEWKFRNGYYRKAERY